MLLCRKSKRKRERQKPHGCMVARARAGQEVYQAAKKREGCMGERLQGIQCATKWMKIAQTLEPGLFFYEYVV